MDGGIGDQRRTFGGSVQLARPVEDELREHQPSLERVDGKRKIERGGGEVAGRGIGEGEFIGVDVTNGEDARQDRGLAELVEEGEASEAHRAPGRQVNRGPRQGQRIARRRKAVDQTTVEQRVNQHRQERRCRGNVEDVGFLRMTSRRIIHA